MRLLLLSLSLWSTLALGQGYDYANLPFLGGDSLFPPGLAHRWRFTTANSGSVSNWIDDIQGFHLIQTNGSAQPLNTSTGMVFQSTHFFDGTNMGVATFPYSYTLVIYYVPDAAGSSANFFSDSVAGNSAFVTTFGGSRNIWRCFQSGTGTFTVTGVIPTNIVQDIEGPNSSNTVYTNGITDIASTQPLLGNFNTLPGSGASITHVILELAYWTNIVFTPTIASNLNYYRRSVYGN